MDFAPHRVVKKLILAFILVPALLLPVQIGHAVFTPSTLSKSLKSCNGLFAAPDPHRALAEKVLGTEAFNVPAKDLLMTVGKFIVSADAAKYTIEQKWAILERLLLQIEILTRISPYDYGWKATRFEVAVNGVVELVGFVGEIGPAMYMDRRGVLYYGMFDNENLDISRYFKFDEKRNNNYLPANLKPSLQQYILFNFLNVLKLREFPPSTN